MCTMLLVFGPERAGGGATTCCGQPTACCAVDVLRCACCVPSMSNCPTRQWAVQGRLTWPCGVLAQYRRRGTCGQPGERRRQQDGRVGKQRWIRQPAAPAMSGAAPCPRCCCRWHARRRCPTPWASTHAHACTPPPTSARDQQVAPRCRCCPRVSETLIIRQAGRWWLLSRALPRHYVCNLQCSRHPQGSAPEAVHAAPSPQLPTPPAVARGPEKRRRRRCRWAPVGKLAPQSGGMMFVAPPSTSACPLPPQALRHILTGGCALSASAIPAARPLCGPCAASQGGPTPTRTYMRRCM